MKKNLNFVMLTLALFVLVIITALQGPQEVGATTTSTGTITIYVNGAQLMPDVAPFIDHNNRTQAPFRAIGEAVGGQVTWLSAGRQVIVEKEGLRVEMTIGRQQYVVNGAPRQMDTAPLIKDGRTFIPVRFLGEALQCEVDWDGRRVLIQDGPPIKTAATETRLQPENGQQVANRFDLGVSSSTLLREWGAPVRKDPGEHGFDWWIYHQDYRNYRQIGIRNGRVVTLYTNSPLWSIYGVPVGGSRTDLEKKVPLTKTFRFSYEGVEFTVEQDENQWRENPLLLDGHQVVQLFFDIHLDNRLTAFRIMDFPTFLAVKPGTFRLSWRYGSSEPRFRPSELSENQRELVYRAREQQIFDLANAVRVRGGLTAFRWDERVAEVARGHSLDMLTHGFFSHTSPNTGDPGDRLSKGGINWRRSAENIAYNYSDAIEAHEAWLNSLGHRLNTLSDRLHYLGVGVIGKYDTQKFVSY